MESLPAPGGAASFSQVLTLQLKDLKNCLLSDHDKRVGVLKDKVSSLEGEVADLRRQLKSAVGETQGKRISTGVDSTDMEVVLTQPSDELESPRNVVESPRRGREAEREAGSPAAGNLFAPGRDSTKHSGGMDFSLQVDEVEDALVSLDDDSQYLSEDPTKRDSASRDPEVSEARHSSKGSLDQASVRNASEGSLDQTIQHSSKDSLVDHKASTDFQEIKSLSSEFSVGSVTAAPHLKEFSVGSVTEKKGKAERLYAFLGAQGGPFASMASSYAPTPIPEVMSRNLSERSTTDNGPQLPHLVAQPLPPTFRHNRHDPPETPVPMLLHQTNTDSGGSEGSPKRLGVQSRGRSPFGVLEDGSGSGNTRSGWNSMAGSCLSSHHGTPRPSGRPTSVHASYNDGDHDGTPRPSQVQPWALQLNSHRRHSGSSSTKTCPVTYSSEPPAVILGTGYRRPSNNDGRRRSGFTQMIPGSRPCTPPEEDHDASAQKITFEVPDVRQSILSDISSNEWNDTDFIPLEVWNDTMWRKSRKKVQMTDQDDSDSEDNRRASVSGAGGLVPISPFNGDQAQEFGSEASTLSLENYYYLEKYVDIMQRFMLPPSSFKHLSWEFAGLALIIYDIVTIPMEVFNNVWNTRTSPLIRIMSWIVRVFWTLDIPHSFITGILNKQGGVIMHPIKVASRFARTWLPLDLLCVILDWTTVWSSRGREYFAAFRVLRLTRIAKLIRLNNSVINNLLEEHIRSEQVILLMEMAKIVCVMILVAHTAACIWYGIGTTSRGGTSWIKANSLEEANFRESYVWAFHWSIALFVGETNYDPMNVEERSFAVSAMFFFYLMSALFVSSMTTKLTRLQIITSTQASQMSALRRYMCDHSISASLSKRVQLNAQYALDAMKRNAPESSIEVLDLVSEPLRMELHFELHAPALMGHPFFDNYHMVNPAGIQKLCHLATSQMLVSTGDIVFSNYEVPAWPRMFFITSGRLLYLQPPMLVTPIHHGQWAAEASLWTSWIHSGTLRAASETTILQIDAAEFAKIVSPFPTNHAHKYAVNFVALLNRFAEQGQRTDLLIDEQEEIIPKIFREVIEQHDQQRKATKRSSKEKLSQTLKRNMTTSNMVLDRAKTIGHLIH